MSNSVLCAIDLAHPEANAKVLSAAERLAKLDNARLDVITVLPDYGMSVVGSYFEPDFHDKAVAHAQDLLRKTIAETLGEEANAEVRHLVATGTAYAEILHAAKEAGSDLIVVGAHKPEFSDFFMGPNASQVVRHAPCSVHVVR